jgi:hypothetical protein
VVNEEFDQRDDLGIAQDNNDTTIFSINIVDNTHDITADFATGTLQIFTSNQDTRSLKPTLAGGLQSLGEYLDGSTWRSSLAVIDTGGDLYSTGTAAARRVQLPWGRASFDFSSLNDDGQTILKNSLTWAADWTPSDGSTEGLLYANDNEGGGSLSEFHVEATGWGAQYFEPTLPADATSWDITKVKFRVREDHDNTVLQLQIRPVDGSRLPTTKVLETVEVTAAELLSYTDHSQWYEIDFTNVTGLDPSVGYVFVIRQQTGTSDHAARIQVQSSSSASGHWITTSNSGSSWSSTGAGQNISLKVYGTYSTN